MTRESTNTELQKTFTDHRAETEGQVARLESAFKKIEKSAKGKKCEAVLGIIEEGKESIDEADEGDVLDAGLIASGQAAEHYEIARYGTLCAWAKQLGRDDVAALLHKTLDEEKAADELLSKIADGSVNEGAQLAA